MKVKSIAKLLPALFLVVLSLVIGWQLLRPGFFPTHDDIQVMRFYQMRRCFDDGQLPCRWSPNMDNEYGQPMFNYYSAFPYYLGTFFNLLGVSFIDVVKLMFLLSLIFSSLFMYLFARRFFSIPASLATAAAYLIAPYHALDIYVRGALAESWGLVFIPALFWAITTVIAKPTVATSLLLSLISAAFLTTHHLTVLMTAPFLIVWTLLTLLFSPKLGEKAPAIARGSGVLKRLKYLFLGGLLGLGLSAFFLLPALLEQHLIRGGEFLTADYFNFRAHFATLRQLFLNTSWSYGPSKFGPDDDISFLIGFVQVFAFVVTPFVLFKTYLKDKRLFALVLFFFLLGGLAIFMTHGKSDPLWTVVPKLAYIQFPWRFLGLVIFSSALLLGAFVHQLPRRFQSVALLLGISALLFFNFRYYRFEKYFYWINDEQKLSGELYNLQARAAILDYLPQAAQVIPSEAQAPALPEIIEGDVEIDYFDKRSAYFAAEFDVKDLGLVRFPVIYFPNWTIYLDRAVTPHPFTYDNGYGLITVELPAGHHLVQGFFLDTPIRTLANSLTFASAFFALLLVLFAYAKTKK